MSHARRLRSLMHLTVLLLAAIVFLCLLVVGFRVPKTSTWTTWSVVVGIGFAGAHVAISCWNPNRHPARNRQDSQLRLQAGMLDVVSPPRAKSATPTTPGHGLTWLHLGILAVSCLSVLAMATPELVRRLKGWNENGNLGVLGPGDSFTVYYPNDKVSFGGVWNGRVTPEIVFSEARSSRMTGLEGTSNVATWGKELRAGGGNRRFQPWATVTLPDNKDLVGRKFPVRVSLVASYPRMSGSKGLTVNGTVDNVYNNESASFSSLCDLILADPGAGRTTRRMWYVFGIGGMFVFLLSQFALAAVGFIRRRE